MGLRLTYLGFITLLAVVVAGAGAWWCVRTPQSVGVAQLTMQPLILADGSVRYVKMEAARPGLPQPPASPSSAPPARVTTTEPALRIIENPANPLPQRLAAVERRFHSPLAPATLAAVLTYLESPVADDPPFAERERALRNHLLNALRQGPAYAELAVPALVRQAADPGQDEGVRDYALQHLAAWVPTLPPPQKQAALHALTEALQDPAGTYAGTALIGLADLAQRNHLDPQFDISAEARRIVLDEKHNISSRLTALTLVAVRPVADPAVETLARKWAESPYIQLGARRAAEDFLRKLAAN